MANYTASATKEEKDRKDLSFRERMALIFGQNFDDLNFSIPNIPNDGADWLDKFSQNPASSEAELVGDLPFLSSPVTNIFMTTNEVRSNMTGSPKDKIFKAFAMAMTAKANKNMREGGVNIKGDSPEEEAILFLAAHFLDLPVTNASAEMQQHAQSLAQEVNIQALWQDFSGEMQAAQAAPSAPKNEQSQPSRLTEIFNREIPEQVKSALDAENINHDTYKTIREDVIKDQDARRNSLKEKYKTAFNLTNKQLDGIVKSMDEEGITSLESGNKRIINYNAQGKANAQAAL